ncbi:hypothetical protein [Leuconostoc citreum]
MNFFNIFKKRIPIKDTIQLKPDNDLDYFSQLSEINKIDIQQFVDFDLMKPEKNYDDSYITDDNFKLRELLLLVWIGKVKKGRERNKPIPKYFLYDYNLNGEHTLNVFQEYGLISIDTKDIMSLTEKGEALSNKYNSLWSMHSFKNNSVNIDLHFDSWNEISFTILQNNRRIKYISQRKKYFETVLQAYSQLDDNLPDYPQNEIKMIDQEIKELININNNLK